MTMDVLVSVKFFLIYVLFLIGQFPIPDAHITQQDRTNNWPPWLRMEETQSHPL